MAAAVWTLSLTLSCCLLLTSADTSPGCTHHAAMGKSYNVPLKAALKPEHRIIWKSKTATLYDSKKTKNAYSVTNEKSLILPKVTSAEAGSYTWELLVVDGVTEKTATVVLCTLDVVSKPKVTFKCDEKQTKVQFDCSGTQPQGVTYHWFEGGKVIPKENKQKLDRTSKQLGSNSFRCNVSNPVSSQSSDPVEQGCLKHSSTPSPASPDSSNSDDEEETLLFGLDLWLMVGILAGGGGLVLALILATICCCIKNRRKRRMQVRDEQELRLQWSTTTNQQPHNHQYVNQRGHAQGHSPRPGTGQTQGPTRDSAGNTGPRPPRGRQNRPRPPDPITGQPLPGPRRHAETGQTHVSVEEENPPPLPQPRKKAPRKSHKV